MLIKSVAPSYLWPGTNDNAPACSLRSRPGLIYALWGDLWAALWRGSIGTPIDTKTPCMDCKWALRRLCFSGLVPLCWTRAKNSRLRAVGGHTSGGKLRGHGQKKTRPRKAQGGRWWYSRFFCKLPDHHDREKDNKQDNQAGVTSILRRAGQARAAHRSLMSQFSNSSSVISPICSRYFCASANLSNVARVQPTPSPT